MLLEQINQVNDIKSIDPAQFPALAEEIREFLIEKISISGGHLASNLGVVELTMALHLAFDPSRDKLIWDVGHQSYTHKLLTGRKNGFDTLRKYGGMSGFPKRKESICDAFDTGHSSTSISAGIGYVMARDLRKEDYSVVSIIGDGAMTGGMAYEAMNNASQLKKNFIIVLNDNAMSISQNVGGISTYLSKIRTAEFYTGLKAGVEQQLNRIPVYGDKMIRGIRSTKQGLKHFLVPGMFFEEMGLTYLGPVDGYNISQMVQVFQEAKKVNGAVLVHVNTVKGRGFFPAERLPSRFHGTVPFEPETGLPRKKKEKSDYTDVFSTVMCKMGEREPKLCAITAAMPDGTGLKRFRNIYPERFFDVGIAEAHAVTFAAGLAAGGMKPVVAVYSSFLQRAYDQVIHDVCIQNLPVVFAIDRAGLVGSDGETHQGLFDISFLMGIPNMCIMAPKNKWELADMLKFAISYPAPIALRYPRGEAYDGLSGFRAPIAYGRAEILYDEKDIALGALGSMVETAGKVRKLLHEYGLSCTLINARFAKPVDEDVLDYLLPDHQLVVTMEEGVANGGFGQKVREYYDSLRHSPKVLTIALPDDYIEHGNVELLKRETGIDSETIYRKVLACFLSL